MELNKDTDCHACIERTSLLRVEECLIHGVLAVYVLGLESVTANQMVVLRNSRFVLYKLYYRSSIEDL